MNLKVLKKSILHWHWIAVFFDDVTWLYISIFQCWVWL